MSEVHGRELNGSDASWPGLEARGEIDNNNSIIGVLDGTGGNGTSGGGGAGWQLPHSTATMVTLTLVVSFIILVTIFGNSLVAIAVFTSKSLKAAQNLFLVSLAAADILAATLVMPFSLAKELMGYWVFGSFWCEMYLALDVLFCTSSIVHLCAISLDRYWSVTQAVRYNIKRTPRRVKRAIVVVWVIAALISFPPLVGTGRPAPGGASGPRQAERPMCRLNEEAWYVLSSCTASFFAPRLIMLLVYARIYQVAKGRARRRSRGDSDRDAPGPEPPVRPQPQPPQQNITVVGPQADVLRSTFPPPPPPPPPPQHHHHHPPPPATPAVPRTPRQNGGCVRNGGADDNDDAGGGSATRGEVFAETAQGKEEEEEQEEGEDDEQKYKGDLRRRQEEQASLLNAGGGGGNGRKSQVPSVGRGGLAGPETPARRAGVSNGKHPAKGDGDVATKQQQQQQQKEKEVVVVVMEERKKDDAAAERNWSSRSAAAAAAEEEEGDAETEAGGEDDDDPAARGSLSLRNDAEGRAGGGVGGSSKLGLCSTKVARRKLTAAREKRFTFVLAVVMGVFVACWFPFFFSYSLKKICPASCTPPDYLFNFFFWFGYCNSSLNPLIYTVFNQDFRRAFKNILCRRRPRMR